MLDTWLTKVAGLVMGVSLLLVIAATANAASTNKPVKLFADASEMQITLSGPWRSLRKTVKKDTRYPATLTYKDPQGRSVSLAVEVAPRGISRRLKVCKFPPLKLYFDKEKLKGSIFRGTKSLKLVTYCQKHPKYEQYYLKEFLAYRIYNLITDFSFRVKPLTVDYIDSENKTKSIRRFSFFIEDLDDVAKRNKLKKMTSGRVSVSQINPQQVSYFSLFQLLIGNLDWSATSSSTQERCCHNSRIINPGEKKIPMYPIPYDFDASGLVDAHYAQPPNNLKLRNIRQRLYRGYCAHKSSLPVAAARFQQHKEAIFQLFSEESRLQIKTRNKVREYIKGFYSILDDPGRFQREVIDKCR